jgi:hypothetical protein
VGKIIDYTYSSAEVRRSGTDEILVSYSSYTYIYKAYLQRAPILVVANMAIMASAQLGI